MPDKKKSSKGGKGKSSQRNKTLPKTGNTSRSSLNSRGKGSRALPELPERNSGGYYSPGGLSNSYYAGRGSRTTGSRSAQSSTGRSRFGTNSFGYSANQSSYGRYGANRSGYGGDIDIPLNNNKKNKKNNNKKNLVSLFSKIKKNADDKNVRVLNNKSISAKRNSIALPIFIFFIVMCFIYIIGSSVNFLTKKIVSYDVLAYGTIDTPKSASAVIVRSEKVYNTDKTGVISYEAADSEKVKKGDVVCSIKDEAVVAQMQETLDEINEEIMKIQNERKDISVYSEDIKKYNSNIKDIIDENALNYAYLKLEDVYELANEINNQLETRNQYLLSENSEALSDLVAQRKEQESKLNENISNITVDESGIVSYFIDGYEEEFTPENMTEIKKSAIRDNIKAESTFKNSVKANSPAFKLVTSNTWYIVSYIDSDYIEGWEKGSSHSIYVKDSEGKEHKLETTVEELVADADGKDDFIILKLTRDMLDFINDRSITIETESSELGYKIPNDAVVEETLLKIPTAYVDTDSNVIKVTDSGTTKVAVTVSGKDPDDENYCYTPVQFGVLNVGDTIKSPESDETFAIADVLNTKGIYVVNTGIAEFRTINLTNAVSNSTHTVLDPTYNTNLYIYDRILTDPRDVEKQEMVYE